MSTSNVIDLELDDLPVPRYGSASPTQSWQSGALYPEPQQQHAPLQTPTPVPRYILHEPGSAGSIFVSGATGPFSTAINGLYVLRETRFTYGKTYWPGAEPQSNEYIKVNDASTSLIFSTSRHCLEFNGNKCRWRIDKLCARDSFEETLAYQLLSGDVWRVRVGVGYEYEDQPSVQVREENECEDQPSLMAMTKKETEQQVRGSRIFTRT